MLQAISTLASWIDKWVDNRNLPEVILLIAGLTILVILLVDLMEL